MIEDFIHLLMCPITKENLALVTRKELLDFFKDKYFQVPDGEKFLINKTQTYLYKFVDNGYPDILPENAISLEKITEQSIPLAFSSDSISFDTLKNHHKNLEANYKIQDNEHNFGSSQKRKKFENVSVHTPRCLSLALILNSTLNLSSWGNCPVESVCQIKVPVYLSGNNVLVSPTIRAGVHKGELFFLNSISRNTESDSLSII